MRGKLILVVGPSGSGKGTLINHVKKLLPELAFPKSSTTRAKRGHDSDKNYNFLTRGEFQAAIDAEKFLEWAEYGGNYYGTPLSEIEPNLADGRIILKELEVQGARQIKEKIPKKELVIIFVHAGTWKEMEARIKKRADMPDVELAKRRERYDDEIGFMSDADYVIENPDGKAERAKKNFEKTLRAILANR